MFSKLIITAVHTYKAQRRQLLLSSGAKRICRNQLERLKHMTSKGEGESVDGKLNVTECLKKSATSKCGISV